MKYLLNKTLMSNILSLACIAIFSLTLFSFTEKDKLNEPKINLEKYDELKADIVNDLNKVTEIAVQIQDRKSVNREEAFEEALGSYYKNAKCIKTYKNVLEGITIQKQTFTIKQKSLINDIVQEMASFENSKQMKNYLSNILDEIILNQHFSSNEKDELLRYITIIRASIDFMEDISNNSLFSWCQLFGGIEVPVNQQCPRFWVVSPLKTSSPVNKCCISTLQMVQSVAISLSNDEPIVSEIVGTTIAAMLIVDV